MFRLFKKKANRRCLEAATKVVSTKIYASLEAGSSIYSMTIEEIDETIRRSPDAQLMTLAVLRPALNFALQDAYLDAGLASSFQPVSIELSHDEERNALRASMDFLPKSRLNLDMQYRYMFVTDVSSNDEDLLWNEMVSTADPIVRRSFEQKTEVHHFWVGVISRLAEGDAEGAWQTLAEAF